MSEYPNNNINSAQNTFNFLPGYASYLHAFIAGFSAIRVKDFQIDIIYPSYNFNSYIGSTPIASQTLPIRTPHQTINYWNITGLSYRGFELDLVYNLNAKTLTIRNRRLTEGYQIPNTKNLEVLFYENYVRVYKTLNVGETVTIPLNTELWQTNNRKNQAMRRSSYPDNIDVLASIYTTQFKSYLKYDSGSSQIKININALFLLIVSTLLFFFYKF